jgi:hypothetical protein
MGKLLPLCQGLHRHFWGCLPLSLVFEGKEIRNWLTKGHQPQSRVCPGRSTVGNCAGAIKTPSFSSSVQLKALCEHSLSLS